MKDIISYVRQFDKIYQFEDGKLVGEVHWPTGEGYFIDIHGNRIANSERLEKELREMLPNYWATGKIKERIVDDP